MISAGETKTLGNICTTGLTLPQQTQCDTKILRGYMEGLNRACNQKSDPEKTNCNNEYAEPSSVLPDTADEFIKGAGMEEEHKRLLDIASGDPARIRSALGPRTPAPQKHVPAEGEAAASVEDTGSVDDWSEALARPRGGRRPVSSEPAPETDAAEDSKAQIKEMEEKRDKIIEVVGDALKIPANRPVGKTRAEAEKLLANKEKMAEWGDLPSAIQKRLRMSGYGRGVYNKVRDFFESRESYAPRITYEIFGGGALNPGGVATDASPPASMAAAGNNTGSCDDPELIALGEPCGGSSAATSSQWGHLQGMVGTSVMFRTLPWKSTRRTAPYIGVEARWLHMTGQRGEGLNNEPGEQAPDLQRWIVGPKFAVEHFFPSGFALGGHAFIGLSRTELQGEISKVNTNGVGGLSGSDYWALYVMGGVTAEFRIHQAVGLVCSADIGYEVPQTSTLSGTFATGTAGSDSFTHVVFDPLNVMVGCGLRFHNP